MREISNVDLRAPPLNRAACPEILIDVKRAGGWSP
jgi:hypothetical protein